MGGVPHAHDPCLALCSSLFHGWDLYWGDDEAGVILYLRAQGVFSDDITKALEGVVQTGGYIIQQQDEA
jgi:hypothetical protein